VGSSRRACCKQIRVVADVFRGDLTRIGKLADLDVLIGLDVERLARRPDVAFVVDLLAL
jgi:hypothetical protein